MQYLKALGSAGMVDSYGYAVPAGQTILIHYDKVYILKALGYCLFVEIRECSMGIFLGCPRLLFWGISEQFHIKLWNNKHTGYYVPDGTRKPWGIGRIQVTHQILRAVRHTVDPR
jgi:hypothetical protein